MPHAPTLQSFIAGSWIGHHGAQVLRSAIDGHELARTHEERPDFAEAIEHGRRQGVSGLMALDFQQRAQRLKAIALYLSERKEQLYALSHHSGATRADSWIDIEGGNSTLFTYASLGSRELPSGNIVHEGPAMQLSKLGSFAGTHILVPRGGLVVHINAFNFPIWGMLEKFAPSFLAGMPCIVKPASATSYLTEAVVRLMDESGLLPPGSLQLVIGSTGDLLDRLQGQDVVTFTGSADTAAKLRVNPNLIRNSVPFNAEADSLNCAILAPDVSPDDEEFELFIKEVAREMTTKAGQKCTAIRRAIVPAKHIDAVATRLRDRLKKSWWATRRWKACAWAHWPPTTSRKTSPNAWKACCRAAICCSAPATALNPAVKTSARARSSPRPCCKPATRMRKAAPTTSRPSARSAR